MLIFGLSCGRRHYRHLSFSVNWLVLAGTFKFRDGIFLAVLASAEWGFLINFSCLPIRILIFCLVWSFWEERAWALLLIAIIWLLWDCLFDGIVVFCASWVITGALLAYWVWKRVFSQLLSHLLCGLLLLLWMTLDRHTDDIRLHDTVTCGRIFRVRLLRFGCFFLSMIDLLWDLIKII